MWSTTPKVNAKIYYVCGGCRVKVNIQFYNKITYFTKSIYYYIKHKIIQTSKKKGQLNLIVEEEPQKTVFFQCRVHVISGMEVFREVCFFFSLKIYSIFLWLNLSILYSMRIYPKYLKSSQNSNDTLLWRKLGTDRKLPQRNKVWEKLVVIIMK